MSAHIPSSELVRWEACLARHARDYDRATEFVRDGAAPRHLFVVLAGWAQIYRQLEDGRRQISAFVLPGEICDLDLFTVARTDYAVSAVREITVAEIGRDTAMALLQDCPRLAGMLIWSEFIAAKRRCEWLTNIGQRNAGERVSHLICELFVRQQPRAVGGGGICDFPLTQAQIAEATGLTQVHVNRTIQDLRRCTGIEVRGRRLHVPDFEILAKLAHFTADYLHRDEAAAVTVRAMAFFGVSTAAAAKRGGAETAGPDSRERAASV